MKKKTLFLTLIILILAITACTGTTPDSVTNNNTAASADNTTTVSAAPSQVAVATPEVEYTSEDLVSTPTDAADTTIQLNGDSIAVDGSGAMANGSTVTITTAGTYQISGTLNDGQIIVDNTDPENVTLIFAGVDIASQSSAPIYVANAEKVIITLAAGSESFVTDSTSYLALDESGEPNAAIFSKDDLTINGEGTLTVNANYNNGIASKDDLKITGGTIMVSAVDDGLKGKILSLSKMVISPLVLVAMASSLRM